MRQRPRDRVIAIACSDIHLTLKPPLARSEEPNWFEAMDRAVDQIRDLQKKHMVPVLCAGDIFDRWNSPPELINWAIEHLPHLCAIPGNHDLPHHRPDLAHRSAYGTLVRAGKVTEIGPNPVLISPDLVVYGREFGEPVPKPDNLGGVQVLLTHEYLWTAGTGHVGAPEECRLDKVAKSFRGYDVVVVGDNHVGFDRVLKRGTHVINCGSLLRRKSNEANYQPRVGLILADGRVKSHALDTDEDVFIRTVTEQEKAEDDEEIAIFVEGLAGLEASSLNFREAMLRVMKAKHVKPEVREQILEAMEP